MQQWVAVAAKSRTRYRHVTIVMMNIQLVVGVSQKLHYTGN